MEVATAKRGNTAVGRQLVAGGSEYTWGGLERKI
jgi:hypothetical protein